MSLRKSNSDQPVGAYRKPRPDLYTVLLVIALLALIVATVFAYLATADYGPPPYQAPSARTTPATQSCFACGPCDRIDRPAGGAEIAPC
jgi:hypothetical protein